MKLDYDEGDKELISIFLLEIAVHGGGDGEVSSRWTMAIASESKVRQIQFNSGGRRWQRQQRPCCL